MIRYCCFIVINFQLMKYINEKRLDKNFMESQLCFKTHFPINFGHKNVKSVFKKEKN